jgi:hypothetical protein
MRMLTQYSIPALVAGALFVSGSASSAIAQEQGAVQAISSQQVPADSVACQSKWIAAGNNGAKAGRYFKAPCGKPHNSPGQEQSFVKADPLKPAPVNPSLCQSKWIAAGNNGARIDRYFKVSC